MKYRVRTGAPKGRRTWESDTAAKVQNSLFATVAMLAAASAEAEKALMDAIAEAKKNKMAVHAA